ncbi:MAG TPA: GGDEF domain-containing protein [Candidatus Sulfotelmatobacter sp.]|nr:GGDEF domain-containing protein [Candidatus Sulfotelmatobacter sp.]
MNQQTIDFRQLLERLLPLDELPPAERRSVQSALLSGVGQQIEQAALLALRRLEESGALVRVPASPNGLGPVLRYEARDSLRVFTIHVAAPEEQDGIRRIPRLSLPSRAPAGIEQVRRLLRLDDPALHHDPRSVAVRDLLREHLEQTGRELLGAARVRFVPRPGGEASLAPTPFDAEVAALALSEPHVLIHAPDLSRSSRLAASGERNGVGSFVALAVTVGPGPPAGHLEVTTRAPLAFDEGALALVVLLADSFGAALERATRLEQLVFVDPLTGVYNRPYFDLQLQNEMARAQRENASLALCLVDIDDFKLFNTRFGYEAGNQVLITVAQSLRSGVRPFDTVSRWGGEEFALLLTSPVSAHDAGAVSERLRALVERQQVAVEALDRAHHELGVTVSIGVALFPEHGATPQELWRAANQALLEAKRPPKNRVVFFEPGNGGPRRGGAGKPVRS